MKKNILKAFISSCLCASLLVGQFAMAANSDSNIKVSYNDIKLYTNNEKLTLTDASGNIVEPFIYEGTTYLPLRAVAEALEMTVEWDGENYCVKLYTGAEKKENTSGTYTPFIGEKNIDIYYRDISVMINDTAIYLKSADGKDIEPFIYEGTTYLPLRAVAEAVSVNVEWDGDAKSIYMEKQIEVRTESAYDATAQSDWTSEEAESYGYTVSVETISDIQYAVLKGYSGEETDVLVPAKIDSLPVYIEKSTAEAGIFVGNENIEYVTFETGVTVSSSSYLFNKCTNLKGIYNLVSKTGGGATFNRCTSLSFIDADLSGTSFNSQYAHCSEVTTVAEIPLEVTNLNSTYYNCAKLSGDIYCKSTKISSAASAFVGTVEKINLHVPYPSVTYDTLTASELPENVTLVTYENRIAYLPKEINVASFTSVDLYNYAVAPQYADCNFAWNCEIGNASADKFTISATEDNVGTYPISVTVSRDGSELYTAESQINVISAKNLSKNFSLLSIGDTYTVSSTVARNRISRYSERIKFIGTRQSSHEGRYGATSGYYFKDFNYTQDKNGMGTTNPFYNPETQTFDMKYFEKYSGFSPSAVQLFFQNYPGGAIAQNIENHRKMVDSIKEYKKDAKIFIVLPAYLKSWSDAQCNAVFEYICALDEEFADDENVYLIPLNLMYNRENFNPQYKHYPNDNGYNQWGDCMFGTYAAALV